MTKWQLLVKKRVTRKVASLRRRGADIDNPFVSMPDMTGWSKSKTYRWFKKLETWSSTRHVVLGDGMVITETRYRAPLKAFTRRNAAAKAAEKKVMELPLPKGVRARKYMGTDFEPQIVRSKPRSITQQENRERAAKYVHFDLSVVTERARTALEGMAAAVGDPRLVDAIRHASSAKLNAAVFRGGAFSMLEPYYPSEGAEHYVVEGYDATADDLIRMLT